MATSPVLCLFRNDLRLADNPALRAAVETGQPVIPLYIWHPWEGDWPPGRAGRWWLRQSLASLQKALAKRGSRLVIQAGNPLSLIPELCRKLGVKQIFLNWRINETEREADDDLEEILSGQGVEVRALNAHLLSEPWSVGTKKDGSPFRVFTPYSNLLLESYEPAPPLPAPERIPAPQSWPRGKTLKNLADLNTAPPAGAAWGEHWTPGEAAALKQLGGFLNEHVDAYPDMRDLPAQDQTSKLSPYLAHGEIGPRQVTQALFEKYNCMHPLDLPDPGAAFFRELLWREFGYHLLYHFPQTPVLPLYEKFLDFPWATNYDADLIAWREGRTGFPMVDAGMRQLNATGWMHNRVRMLVASILTKHLLIPWQAGAKYFWDRLVDADLASNTLNWQWGAGCGADAAPYWRVFNPTRQGERFDENGDYIRRWVPVLAGLPDKKIHSPWTATAAQRKKASIILGKTYPGPIIDHKEGRERALAAYEIIKGQ